MIIIKGARQHNLKNIDLELPKNKLIVFSGISGSGKSSLAFDTIYAEGQRRYVESLSSYARQFLGVMDRPEVDLIEGLQPSIAIDQKSTSHNPRSTVGTVTEIYDYLRLLFARIGHPHCPVCGREIAKQSPGEITDQIIEILKMEVKKRLRPVRVLLLSPVVRGRRGEFTYLLESIKAKGYPQARIDRQIYNLSSPLVLIKTNKHTIEVVVDKFSLDRRQLSDPVSLSNIKGRLFDSSNRALNLSDGLVVISLVNDPSFSFPENPKDFDDHLFSERFACPVDNISLSEIEPRTFSFNSPYGACPTCSGIGSLLKINPATVLNPQLSVTEGGILPFAKIIEKDTWFGRLLLTVCQKYGIDPKKPLSKITQQQKDILLYGTGEEIHEVYGTNRFGRMTKIHETFAGIVAELETRYTETESPWIKKEIEKYMIIKPCPNCLGSRLKKEALSITVDQKSIAEVTKLSIEKAYQWTDKLKTEKNLLSERERKIGDLIIDEIKTRLEFLKAVGLDYLTLERGSSTLASGETQRIRLASQIGSGLTGVLYVLDEPSIGLHPRDNKRLIETLKKLRDLGNSVIVVEHDRKMIESADLVVDFGPGAGEHGGKIIAYGSPNQIKESQDSETGKYLSGKKKIILPKRSLPENSQKLIIKGCSEQNLKKIDVSIPLGEFVCITGVSGSGKSTLMETTLYHALLSYLNPYHRIPAGRFDNIQGIEHINRVIMIDQSPIGRTPRSNPATYTGAFTYIRQIFSQTREARALGLTPGHFSFNVKGGRCEACQGEGMLQIEMQFMPNVYITCEVCGGRRFVSQTLEVTYKGKNIAEVLEMTVEEAVSFFTAITPLYQKLVTLSEVGLSYIKLGQAAPTLSGGEAQRVKLARELSKKSQGKTIYLLDEPTTGLHFADLEKLLAVLRKLVERGNTIVVIEHNLDIIRNADWIIDLGPEGGDKGGEIVANGPPEEIAEVKHSYTGQFLRKIILNKK